MDNRQAYEIADAIRELALAIRELARTQMPPEDEVEDLLSEQTMD